MSTLRMETVRTSKTHETKVIITSQQVNNDYNGNPRHFIQVWVLRESGMGNLWLPKIKGYRFSEAKQGWTITSYNINSDINTFLESFEKTVYQED